MLQYMYTGETLIQQERVSNFLEVAKELDIGDIMKTLLNIAPEDDDEEEDEEVEGDTLAEDVSVMQEIESEVVKLEKVVKEPAKRKESSASLPWKDKDSTVTLPWQVMESAKASSNLHAVTTNTLTSSGKAAPYRTASTAAWMNLLWLKSSSACIAGVQPASAVVPATAR